MKKIKKTPSLAILLIPMIIVVVSLILTFSNIIDVGTTIIIIVLTLIYQMLMLIYDWITFVVLIRSEKEVERMSEGHFQTQPNPDCDIIGEVCGGE